MWFRNLQLYRLTEPFTLGPEDLAAQLSARTFRPCGSIEAFSLGWVPPLGDPQASLVHAANGCLMMCARRQEKLLPAAVVNEELAERLEEIEAREGRRVGGKERQRLRDEVLQDFLPRAFTRSQRLFAYLDPAQQWLIVDAATSKKAEDLISFLRETLGTLPAKPLSVKHRPAQVMTGWVQSGQPPGDLQLLDECELRDPEEIGGIVRCRRQDLSGEEVGTHLEAGKQVTKLALEWEEHLSCLLDDELGIKRLRFSDLILEEAGQVDSEDQAARFDADFALMSLELRRFLTLLLEAFGGSESESV